ncbi:MAG: DUF3365 domain-containing protein [Nitrosomonadales bacterium]|nr:DUF3365 domain-containing protein [Nitrosomonadales bacterium]
MRNKIILTALFALSATPALADDIAQYQGESRAVVGPFMQKLLEENKKAIKEGGPDSAIKVCKDIAPKMAGDLSRQHGIKLTRVSLKVRNPLLGTADEWEQKTLKQFEERLAKGEKPETLEAAEIVNEPAGKYFRYMKGIVLQSGCVACHGTDDAVDMTVKARLKEEYPHDKATGYVAGQVRGGVSIKRAL